jgi:hypothetical protein
MILDHFMKRRALKVLSSYLSEDGILDVMNGRVSSNELRSSPIEIILAMVRGDTLAVLSERVEQVAEIAARNEALLDTQVSSLTIATYGMPPHTKTSKYDRWTLTKDLAEGLGENIKIIHCVRDCTWGNLGSKTRLSYTFMAPDFSELLQELTRLEFGASKDLGVPI